MKDEELEKYISKKVAIYFIYVSDVSDKSIDDKDYKQCIGMLCHYYLGGVDKRYYSCKKENDCNHVFISGYVRKIIEIN